MLDSEGLSLKDIAKNALVLRKKQELFIGIAPFNEVYNKENTYS